MKKIELVCIIDDDPIHQLLIKRHLKNTGMVKNYLDFKNGKEAYYELISKKENNEKLPDIIFLDIQMPVWDGWQFLEEFTKLGLENEVEIFMVTSSIFENDYKKAEGFGLENKYLVKPVNTDKLKECIQKILDQNSDN